MINNIISMTTDSSGLQVRTVSKVRTDDDIRDLLIDQARKYGVVLSGSIVDNFNLLFSKALDFEFENFKKTSEYRDRLKVLLNKVIGGKIASGDLDLEDTSSIINLKKELEESFTVDDYISPVMYTKCKKLVEVCQAICYTEYETKIYPYPDIYYMNLGKVTENDSRITFLKSFYSTDVIVVFNNFAVIFNPKDNVSMLRHCTMMDLRPMFTIGLYNLYKDIASVSYPMRILHYTIRRDASRKYWLIYQDYLGEPTCFCLDNMTKKDYSSFLYHMRIATIHLTPTCENVKAAILKKYGFSCYPNNFSIETALDQIYPFLKVERITQRLLFRIYGVDADDVISVIDDASTFAPGIDDQNFKFLFDLQGRIFADYYLKTVNLVQEWSIISLKDLMKNPSIQHSYYFLYLRPISTNFSSFYTSQNLPAKITAYVTLVTIFDYYRSVVGTDDERYTEVVAEIPNYIERDKSILAVCNNIVIMKSDHDSVMNGLFKNIQVNIVWTIDSFLLVSRDCSIILTCGLEYHNIVYNRMRLNNFVGSTAGISIDDDKYMVRKYTDTDLPEYVPISINDRYTEGTVIKGNDDDDFDF